MGLVSWSLFLWGWWWISSWKPQMLGKGGLARPGLVWKGKASFGKEGEGNGCWCSTGSWGAVNVCARARVCVWYTGVAADVSRTQVSRSVVTRLGFVSNPE